MGDHATQGGAEGAAPAVASWGPEEVGFMRRALDLAALGAGQVAPNPKVGAVLVRDGITVGEGWHRRFGGAHAEAEALATAGERARGATAYVTLEPCAHQGKTPPCADALIAAGVKRVVCAIRDPHAEAAGGIERLRAAGVTVEVGLLEQEARLLNAPFLHAVTEPALPFVTLKLALSIDGAIVDASRNRGQLTGPEAMAAVHAMRAEADAVAVGIGTALADDPALTVRLAPPPRKTPLRVVFDRRARLPIDSVLVASAREAPVLVVTAGTRSAAEQGLRDHGVEVMVAVTLRDALTALRRRGIRHLLVEGGANLSSALLAEGLVHHVVIFQAPVILGAGALPAFAALPAQAASSAPRLTVLERQGFGDDLMTRYAVAGD